MRRIKNLMHTSLSFFTIFGTLAAIIVIFAPLDCSDPEPENRVTLPPGITPDQIPKMFKPDQPFPLHPEAYKFRPKSVDPQEK